MGVRGKQRGLLTPCLVGSLTQIRLSDLHRHLLLPAQDSTFGWHVPTNRVPDLCDAPNCLSLIFFSAAAVGGAGSLDVAVTLRPLALRVAGVHVHVHVPLIQVFVVEVGNSFHTSQTFELKLSLKPDELYKTNLRGSTTNSKHGAAHIFFFIVFKCYWKRRFGRNVAPIWCGVAHVAFHPTCVRA